MLARITLFALIVATFFVPAYTVHGAPQEYLWEYNVTNVYTNHTLSYDVSSLDTATQYTFQFQLLDTSGNVKNIVETSIIGPGVTTDSFGTDFAGYEDVYGPLRVIDQFGQVLGEHFVAPAYLDDWQSNGTNPAADKQGIGDVPYVEENADSGYQHPVRDHTAVLTRVGEWTLLHYRLGALVPPTNRKIVIFDSETATEVAEFDMDELYQYNQHVDSTDTAFVGISFIVLNTSGDAPNFINESQDAAAFTDVNFDNPHELELGAGLYQYARYDLTDVLISFGESVWVVSNNVAEWTVAVKKPSVQEGGQQCLDLRQYTQEVFTDYPDQLVTDSSVGDVDDTNYDFDTFRKVCYSAGTEAQSPALATWEWKAFDMVEPSIDVDDFAFEIGASYTISNPMQFDAIDTLGNGLTAFGLDSTLGNLVAMLGGMLAVMFVTRNPLVALIAFLGIGGMFVIFGFATTLTKIVFALGAIMAIILFVRGTRQQSEGI